MIATVTGNLPKENIKASAVGAEDEHTAAAVGDELFTLLADNIHSSNLPTLLVGALYAVIYTYSNDLVETWVWWLLLTAALAWRFWLLRGTGTPPSRAGTRLYLSMALIGVIWAAAPIIVVMLLNDSVAFTALLLATGIVIAAFSSYGMDTRATFLVTVPIGLSVVGVSAASDIPAFNTIAFALPLLYVHQYFVMRRARTVLENQIRLRIENAALARELSERAQKTSAELNRRMETERMLRASRDRAERMSATDSLTEIANRRYFDKRLASEVSRAFRDRTSLSLVMCDIDYFKQFNDLYGHGEGDECLKGFARTLESYCRRGGDLAARVGGEEFALLLPQTEHQAAMDLAERARAGFDDMAVPHEGSEVKGNATASFGVATDMPNGLNAGEELLRRADRALYAAKHLGRNRVISTTEITEARAD